jgi:hypothetical protein
LTIKGATDGDQKPDCSRAESAGSAAKREPPTPKRRRRQFMGDCRFRVSPFAKSAPVIWISAQIFPGKSGGVEVAQILVGFRSSPVGLSHSASLSREEIETGLADSCAFGGIRKAAKRHRVMPIGDRLNAGK